MTSRHLVDPELAPILDLFSSSDELSLETLPQIRAESAIMSMQQATSPATDMEVTERRVPGPEGAPDVRVLLYVPKNVARPMPGLLWIHGGGYVLGSPVAEEEGVRAMVREVGCVAVSVDYRLAPETPHPGPVEDCYAALKWLYANADELGVDTTRLAIAGASAGGGLAAALGLLARDRGEIPLAFQLLIFPMIDDRTAVASDPHPYTGEFIWTRQANNFGWSSLLGTEPGGKDISPYAAAARAENLAGLPATYISVGALDLFLEEDMEYARRLIRAGVPTELHVYPGAYHGYPLVPYATVSLTEARNSRAAVKRALSPAASATP